MYALGEAEVLENLYSTAGFLDVSVHAVSTTRHFPSASDVIRTMRNNAGDTGQLMDGLNEANREVAWAEIEQQFTQFEGLNGLEIPGEVLIGVGTK